MTLTGLGFTLSYYLMSFGSESMFLLLLLCDCCTNHMLLYYRIAGTLGYFSCFWFNVQIYGSIKVD